MNRVRRGTRRAWLQTELAKAWIAEAEGGRPGARDQALGALANLDRHFLRKPFREGWIDQLDEAGRPIPGPVPASTLYHIQVAIVEAHRVLKPDPEARIPWPDFFFGIRPSLAYRTRMAPRPIAYNLLRLIMAATHTTPRGVDRVDYGYISYLLDHWKPMSSA